MGTSLMTAADEVAGRFDRDRTVLIAGPTASGKSALALALARSQGGLIVNADAIQVYEDWRILTARPSPEEEEEAPHALYGHIPRDHPYSVGEWLREVKSLLEGPDRLIIVGGTGLYFSALTEGLAEIPATPDEIRAEAMQRLESGGLAGLLAGIDGETLGRIDQNNPARVLRAWEVQQSTGKPLAQWQDETPPPLLPLDRAQTALFDAPKDWLTPRIEGRFQKMIEAGVLDEARANREGWSASLPSCKAIGAAELMAVLEGSLTLEAAATRVAILTRQFAKRQRTWFRARMSAWPKIHPAELT